MNSTLSDEQISPVFRFLYFLILLFGLTIGVQAASAASSTDTDHDGMPDWWENRSFGAGHLDFNSDDAREDPDADGLDNLSEFFHGTNPFNPDTDGDGLSDGEEVNRYGANPLMWDTDGGGHSDGFEILNGRNPLDPDDDAAGMSSTIRLTPGWNLFSLPLAPQNTAVTSVLTAISGKYISIWSYQNGHWRTFDPDNPGFSDLSVLEPGRGYWINMTAAGDLPVSGAPASRSISLNSGWNLVGYNLSASQDVGTALSSISGKYINVWTFSDGVWKVYDPVNPGFSDLTHFHPGQGYWINTTTACIWTLP